MSRGIRSQLAPKSLEFKASEFYISDKYATILSVISIQGLLCLVIYQHLLIFQELKLL